MVSSYLEGREYVALDSLIEHKQTTIALYDKDVTIFIPKFWLYSGTVNTNKHICKFVNRIFGIHVTINELRDIADTNELYNGMFYITTEFN